MCQQLTLLEWNVNRSSVRRFRRQDVDIKAGPRAGELLVDALPPGDAFEHVVYSQSLIDDTDDEEPTASGVLFASRYPFEMMEPGELGVPIDHRALSAVFDTPFGPIEGHVVHVVPGSSYGWTESWLQNTPTRLQSHLAR